MGVSLRQLGPVIGISTASLFGYRSGAMPITSKAWAKIEAAERNLESAQSRGDLYPASPVSICEPDSVPYMTERDRRLERIEKMLDQIGRHLGVKFDDPE